MQLLKETIVTFLSVFPQGGVGAKSALTPILFNVLLLLIPVEAGLASVRGQDTAGLPIWESVVDEDRSMGDKQKVAGGSPVLQESEEEEDYL